MMRMRLGMICCTVSIAGLLVLPREAFAETNPPQERDGITVEESARDIKPLPRDRAEPRCSAPEIRGSMGPGRLVGDFLAFGCRLNYRLTDWILGDKCDCPETQCNRQPAGTLCD